MDLARLTTALIVIAVFLVVATLVVLIVFWRRLREVRRDQNKCKDTIRRLEFVHDDLLIAIQVVESGAVKTDNDFHKKKLQRLKDTLAKNEQEAKEVQEALKMCTAEIKMLEEMFREIGKPFREIRKLFRKIGQLFR